LVAELVSLFLLAFGVGLSGSLIPGPMLALNIAETARRGFWAAPMLVLGHGLAEAALVAALALGLSPVLQKELPIAVVGVLGGLFLGWMGLGLLRQKNEGVVLSASPSRRAFPVLGGVMVSVANPTWLLWWAAVGSTFVVWALRLGLAGLVTFYLGHILSDLSWYSLVGVLVSRGLAPKLYRGLMMACGVFLIALAGYFVYSGGAFFLRA
jgi:threonine/homoserine/homoserine lactone efflux protein